MRDIIVIMRDIIVVILFISFIIFSICVSVWYEKERNAKPVDSLGKEPYIITPQGLVTYEEHVDE